MYHGFDRDLAVEIGLEPAIIFRVIAGKVATKVKHGNCGLIELSVDNLLLVCPYISKYQVSKSINTLIERQLLEARSVGAGRSRQFALTQAGKEQFRKNSKSSFENSKSNVENSKSSSSGAKSSFPSSIDQLDQKNTNTRTHANNSVSFAMQENWQPRQGFLNQAALAGANTTQQKLDQLLVQFRLGNASGQLRTQAQWESVLISWIRTDNNKTAKRSITGAPPRSKYQQSRSAMEGFLND